MMELKEDQDQQDLPVLQELELKVQEDIQDQKGQLEEMDQMDPQDPQDLKELKDQEDQLEQDLREKEVTLDPMDWMVHQDHKEKWDHQD